MLKFYSDSFIEETCHGPVSVAFHFNYWWKPGQATAQSVAYLDWDQLRSACLEGNFEATPTFLGKIGYPKPWVIFLVKVLLLAENQYMVGCHGVW